MKKIITIATTASLIYFYTFDESGKQALFERGLFITQTGKLEKTLPK